MAAYCEGEFMRSIRLVLVAAVAATTLFAGAGPAWAAPPPNDDFDAATVVTEPLPFTDSISTVEATTAADDPVDCGGNVATVWYTYTPSAAGPVSADTIGSDYATTLSVYTGTRGALTQIACDAPFGTARVTWDAVAGTTYYLMVGSQAGLSDPPGGALSFTVRELQPPPNDDFDAATVVTEPLPFTDSLSTIDATSAPDDPTDCAGGFPRTVWYTYTPSAGGFINANTFGSDSDTFVSVYTGTRGALTPIACNFGTVTLEVVAGTTYLIMVGTSGDALSFTVRELRPSTVDVTLDRTGRVDPRTGAVTVSGTFTCTNAIAVRGGGELRQQAGRLTIVGSFEFADEGSCDGAPHRWTAQSSGGNGRFVGGKTAASVFAQVCGELGCSSDFAERTVILQG
jgi:hypothetical protein